MLLTLASVYSYAVLQLLGGTQNLPPPQVRSTAITFWSASPLHTVEMDITNGVCLPTLQTPSLLNNTQAVGVPLTNSQSPFTVSEATLPLPQGSVCDPLAAACMAENDAPNIYLCVYISRLVCQRYDIALLIL